MGFNLKTCVLQVIQNIFFVKNVSSDILYYLIAISTSLVIQLLPELKGCFSRIPANMPLCRQVSDKNRLIVLVSDFKLAFIFT